MREKKAVIKSIILFMCLLFAGYAIFEHNINTESIGAEKKSHEEDKLSVTFDWYINFSWFSQKWGEDVTSKYVTEKTGVNINFITPPNDTGENLATLIANEDIPDFITIESWDNSVQSLIDNDLVYALDELSNKYDAYFLKTADQQTLDWYRENDGHIYAYPNASMSMEQFEKFKTFDVSTQTFLVRKDIYEAIGKPDMRTPEGFIKALIKARQLYPEIDGKPMIPIGIHNFTDIGNYSLDAYLQNYLAIPYEIEGQLYDRYTDKEYITWLKTFRKAYELGLLVPDIFVDKKLQIEEKIAQGRYFALLYQSSDIITPQLELYKEDKDKIYIAVDGPANSNLDKPRLEASNSISGWTVTLISKECKNPERAIKFLTYLMSEEGNKDLYLGEESVTWENINGKEQLIPKVENLLNSDRVEFSKKYGAAHTYWMMMDNNIVNKWVSEVKEPIKSMKEYERGNTYYNSIYLNLAPKGNSTESLIYGKLGILWGETLFKLITAESDDIFDKIFKEYLSKREELGYNKVLKYQQIQLEENKKKLGIE